MFKTTESPPRFPGAEILLFAKRVPLRLAIRLADYDRAMRIRILARCADCIDLVVVVVADLGDELCLEHTAVTDREARCQSISIDDRHLDGVHTAVVQRHHARRIAAYTCCCTLARRDTPAAP